MSEDELKCPECGNELRLDTETGGHVCTNASCNTIYV